MQTILSNDKAVIETPIMRLYRLREEYYNALIEQLDTYKYRRIELINDYRNTVKDIDKQIEIEKNREKRLLNITRR